MTEKRKKLLQALEGEISRAMAQVIHEKMRKEFPHLFEETDDPEEVSYTDDDVWCEPE